MIIKEVTTEEYGDWRESYDEDDFNKKSLNERREIIYKEDLKKAYEESLKGKICILLLPVTTDIPIFHDLILPFGEIRFIKGRVKFKGYNSKGIYTEKGTGQSGSMFVIFRNNCKCGKKVKGYLGLTGTKQKPICEDCIKEIEDSEIVHKMKQEEEDV